MSEKYTEEELTTEDYQPVTIAAGKLDAVGVNCVLNSYERKEGKFGPFTCLYGVRLEDDQMFSMLSSSTKMFKLIEEHWEKIVGKKINISGVGDKFEREYIIRFLPQ